MLLTSAGVPLALGLANPAAPRATELWTAPVGQGHSGPPRQNWCGTRHADASWPPTRAGGRWDQPLPVTSLPSVRYPRQRVATADDGTTCRAEWARGDRLLGAAR